MSDELERLRAHYQATAEGNFSGAAINFGPDVEFRWSPKTRQVSGDEVYRGLDSVWSATRSFLMHFDRFWVTAEEFISAGDRVVVLVREHAVVKGSGVAVERELANVWTFRDGRAIRFEEFDDREEAIAAAGLPRPDQAMA